MGERQAARDGLPPMPTRSPIQSPTSSASSYPVSFPADGSEASSARFSAIGQSFVQEVDHATSRWMKMLSSTFLGNGAAGSRAESGPAASIGPAHSGPDTFSANLEFKIGIVGGPGVGKTSIVRRWLQRPFRVTYNPTIGADVSSLKFRSPKTGNREVILHIWDVSSIEVDTGKGISASSLQSLLCEELDGLFMVFNVHRVSSIAAIDKWRHNLGQYISAKEIPFFLLAHKADMIQKRVMASDDINSYAKAAGFKGWMWTVGRSSFGENERHPAVMAALERMVEFIIKNRSSQRSMKSMEFMDKPQPLFGSAETSLPIESGPSEDDSTEFSASLLRLPTFAITSLPRQDVEDESVGHNESKAGTAQELWPRRDYGSYWILGRDDGKGLYVHSDSFIAREEEESSEEETEFSFPFANVKYLDSEEEEEDESVEEVGETEEEKEERKREQDRLNDEMVWKFFAGSITRSRSESLLKDRPEGSFLLRRKDARTLILSYVGQDHVHHVLIEYAYKQYHIGASRRSRASFSTLWRCLRSVRKNAYRGLVFSRNLSFNIVQKDGEMESSGETDTWSLTTPAAWHRASSISSSSGSFNTVPSSSPIRSEKKEKDMQVRQEHVQAPPEAQVDMLSNAFYDQLIQKLEHVEGTEELMELVQKERKKKGLDGEAKWRHLIQSMEAWNRIVMSLETKV